MQNCKRLTSLRSQALFGPREIGEEGGRGGGEKGRRRACRQPLVFLVTRGRQRPRISIGQNLTVTQIYAKPTQQHINTLRKSKSRWKFEGRTEATAIKELLTGKDCCSWDSIYYLFSLQICRASEAQVLRGIKTDQR